jgi:uncharacterized protein YecA (UPF0149 family)
MIFDLSSSLFTINYSLLFLEAFVISAIKKLFGNGVERPVHRLARNDDCWCGSGNKYKRCHLEKDVAKDRLRADACRTNS